MRTTVICTEALSDKLIARTLLLVSSLSTLRPLSATDTGLRTRPWLLRLYWRSGCSDRRGCRDGLKWVAWWVNLCSPTPLLPHLQDELDRADK